MNLTEWIAGTNQILAHAAQNLPSEYVDILRMQQQTLMVVGLNDGSISLDGEPPTFINFWGEREEVFTFEWLPPTAEDHKLIPSNVPGHFGASYDPFKNQSFQKDFDPRSERPAYLDDPEFQFEHAGSMAKPLPPTGESTPKDWNKPLGGYGKSVPKDWSKLGI